jgi:hypothetical protein
MGGFNFIGEATIRGLGQYSYRGYVTRDGYEKTGATTIYLHVLTGVPKPSTKDCRECHRERLAD